MAIAVVDADELHDFVDAGGFSLDAGAGSDRALFAGLYVSGTANSTPNFVRFNSVGLSAVGNIAGPNSGQLFIYKLVAPDTGAHTLEFSNNVTRNHILMGITLSGVDQTTPNGALQTASGTTDPATVNVSSEAGDLVIDFLTMVHSGGGGGITAGAGQTAHIEVDAWGGGIFSSGASSEPGGATVTMSWALAVIDDWVQAALNINASGAAPKKFILSQPSA